MILTTTPSIEGHRIDAYLGIVSAEVIAGANVVRDFMAGISDIIGGRSGAFEQKMTEARKEAEAELRKNAAATGADAVVGVTFDIEVVGQSMLMTVAYGTAVRLARA